MSDPAAGAAVSEARRVLELRCMVTRLPCAEEMQERRMLECYCDNCRSWRKGKATAFYVLAADAALAAWERWVALRKQWADDDLLIANPKDQKKLSHEMQAAYNDAVRLTAEARGK